MFFAPMSGTQIAYEEAGNPNGRPMLLLHASLQTAESMAPLRELDCLQQFRLIIPDQRGHGRTANPSGSLSIPQMADDMAALMQYLGLRQPIVAGYSLGGTVAVALATRGLVSGLIVLASRITTAPKGRRAFHPDEIRSRSPQWVDQLAVKHEETPWAELAVSIGMMFEDWPGFTAEQLRSIACPVIAIQGDKDQMVDLADARSLAATVPRGELRIIPRAGHPELLYRQDARHAVCEFITQKLIGIDG